MTTAYEVFEVDAPRGPATPLVQQVPACHDVTVLGIHAAGAGR